MSDYQQGFATAVALAALVWAAFPRRWLTAVAYLLETRSHT